MKTYNKVSTRNFIFLSAAMCLLAWKEKEAIKPLGEILALQVLCAPLLSPDSSAILHSLGFPEWQEDRNTPQA